MRSRQFPLVGALMLSAGMAWAFATQPATVGAIRTSPQARSRYLAHALIWQDPGELSPTDLLDGPAGTLPYTFAQATTDEGVACTFVRPGTMIGGNSPKFLCRTPDGHDLRVKYWDPQSREGNREVFAMIAASRLMWALGFNAIPALPVNVRCDECPENPHQGSGSRRTRRFIAMVQARWQAPVILSSGNIDQGWSWLELDRAIRALPPGPERARQRTHFDALSLLGVFIQHGDRKPEQQRLYCAAAVDTAGGDVQDEQSGATDRTLFERPDASACPASAVTIADVGATFGGAGRSSNGMTAKMNLDTWERRSVFTETTGECRGELSVSLKAGHDGEPNPVISEEGRRFFLEQLHRLTADHVRAIFTAARVDVLERQDAGGSADRTRAIDAWVAAFQNKVRQIDARHCPPAA